MGIIDHFKKTDINKGVEEFKKTPDAVLIDVRNAEEFKAGHIPGSINIPEMDIQKVEEIVPDHDRPIFVYCLSGAKSWNTVMKMETFGYKKVRNIGGINHYTGLKVTQ